jgi:predicted helicase
MEFLDLLSKYRETSFTEKDKGYRFERLMQAFLKNDPKYTPILKDVWLWSDFPYRQDFGGKDVGIDLVAQTFDGDYWAIQCKCFQEGSYIDKPTVDSFLATSSRLFGEKGIGFAHRLWISTTNNWGSNAEEAIHNQSPPVSRINLHDLEASPVIWENLEKGITGDLSLRPKKQLFAHQKHALELTSAYFKESDRGKLIMACGTGKTFTTLRIAEHETQGKGFILFLVPSIGLLGQTLGEWSAEAQEAINAVCICSDSKVSKKELIDDRTGSSSSVDLALPASTNIKGIIRQLNHIHLHRKGGMTVVFSTYQSIDVIAQVQKELLSQKKDSCPYGEFDLIICDEAHRTTGVTLSGEDESAFVRVHDNDKLKAKKRIYMTATPRLYSDDAKGKAAQKDAYLCSMDDYSLYGDEIYRLGFGESVDRDLLTDYKVLILTLSDKDITPAVRSLIENKEKNIDTDDASKLIGCINALSKQVLGDAGIIRQSDPEPMRRAVAFCQNIAISKKITDLFNQTSESYLSDLPESKKDVMVSVSSMHIDGTMAAPKRDELLGWLKRKSEDNRECRVLNNVRCLSEGVDVPSLDAVMFLSARNSQIDVVQSVGRVMRKAPGKKYGYIIIPVVVPSDVDAKTALDDNNRYKVVWTVLNALRAHDDRFNAEINKIELNRKKPVHIIVGPIGGPDDIEEDSDHSDRNGKELPKLSTQMLLRFEQLQNVVFARMVEKVGDKRYWEQWAQNVAEIAERQVERITRLIQNDGVHKKVFAQFLKGLHKNINPSITESEAAEMLSQHIITKPVFEALFEGYSFVKNNPISVSMQKMLDLLEAQAIEKDTVTLDKFYDSVRKRAEGIDNAEGKQRIIIELYDKFFKAAFPKMVERLGIVYTPIEIVDFIIHSVEEVLKKEFGRCLSDENIHVLDPFTGTGTFITRLLQSGLIKSQDLQRKYHNEIHANEIVLLAYYIAAINIENAYHDLLNEDVYQAFDGICLTDTFQLGETPESEKLFSEMFPQNSERVVKQKGSPLRVIMGNPPYSVGQNSANDNAQNQKYEKLEGRIADTYVKHSTANLKNSLYDSYIKAFRWSTDRLDPKNGGVIAFVSNGAWIDGNATSGFRICLEKEFSTIYVFNLRGNQRTSGELSRKEGGKIFGSGSRTPISITLLVKNPEKKEQKATIYYRDIGDYLTREEKLAIVKRHGSISDKDLQLVRLNPNEHGDWINHRNDLFGSFIPLGDKGDKRHQTFFMPFYSNGLKTNRDSWCYNSSYKEVIGNIKRSINYYNSQVESFLKEKKENVLLSIDEYLKTRIDSKQFSWDAAQKIDLEKSKKYSFSDDSVRLFIYRPFFKQTGYFHRDLNNRVYQIPKLFPTQDSENVVICVSGTTNNFSPLISDVIPDLHFNGDTQCFPLYYYEENEKKQRSLFSEGNSDFIKRDGISDFILERAHKVYGKQVTKADIFYYVYGFLHSPDYKSLFQNDLKKMLPRIPLIDEPRDFWKFSKAGRELAYLHINYETVPPFEGVIVDGAESGQFRVEKMRFPQKGQKDTILYNSKITIKNIPEKAYEYVVNGKSAIEWVMERYQVTVHKESGIKNDPNDWAEDMDNPRYILDLLLSVINVSVKTVEIVNGLPELRFS